MNWLEAYTLANIHANNGDRCKLYKENGRWFVILN